MTPRGAQVRADLELIRSVIWDIDPLGVAEYQELASDEYNDLARTMVSALHRRDDDVEVDAEWDHLVATLSRNPTPLTGYAEFLHAGCAHSFVRSLRGEVFHLAYPWG